MRLFVLFSFPLLILIPVIPSFSQQISQVKITQESNEVIVRYRLDGVQGKAYHIDLYASHDNFTTALKEVIGDVNETRVLPGADKSIRWDALKELKSFNGDISFELRAVPAPPLFSEIKTSTNKVKRGKSIQISWTGASLAKVELIRGTTHLLAGENEVEKIDFTIPKKIKKGNYKILLSHKGEEIEGPDFAIRPAIPAVVKIAVVVATGIGIWFATKEPELSEPQKLPNAPDLTGN